MLNYFLAKIARARAEGGSRLSALGLAGAAQIGLGSAIALISVPLIAMARSAVALCFLLLGLALSAAGRETGSVRLKWLATAFDLIIFASLPFAFALADPTRALASAFVLFGMVATGAASLFANEDRELANIDVAACVLAFALACLAPQWFSLIAYVLGLLCFIAAGARFALSLTRTGV